MTKNFTVKITIFILFLVGSFAFIQHSLAQVCPPNTVVEATSAILVGEITDDGGDPNLTVWFQYGRTSSYGSETSRQSRHGTGSFCVPISNLNPCTTYHFRAVAQNSAGTNHGENRTFTTRCISPTVDIKANNSDGPITISHNTAATLTWSSDNTTSCTASGAWSGVRTISGSQSTGNLISSRTYTLACTGAGGSISDSVTVNVSSPLPTVDIRANNSNAPITVSYMSNVALSWTSQNAVSCVASGDWSGSKLLSGSEQIQLNSVRTHTFTLSCQNQEGATSQDSVQVIVVPRPPVVITKPAVVTR